MISSQVSQQFLHHLSIKRNKAMPINNSSISLLSVSVFMRIDRVNRVRACKMDGLKMLDVFSRFRA
jgi:hypothetical protein